ncbi:HD domain-containing phosphohydrolase [Desulfosporosinus sp. FKB]|uniref:HD-GYP domain-containing protein n=1 Tax=Desulfosporosinus sp. FKB TaxID=1969835 RepID=UPI001FA89347|nr:HD domain-containing phosphohydrolase [Desulfosporosinus sp. FKB]
MLAKGSLITSNVLAKLKRQEVYKMETRSEKKTLIKTTKTIKEFSKDVYVKLVGSLWIIYHEAKLLQPQHIEKMLALVNVIMEELRTKDTFLDLEGNRINLERYKQHDFGIYTHVLNVALLSAIIGLQLSYNENKLKNLILGALLHDLGKLQVPKEILNKPGILTEEERDVIKQHPLLGEEMLKDARLISSVLATIKEHHERWNGRGYPFGLKGQEIYQDAQIVAVADVYEALTADRPYRKGLPPY